MWLIVTVLPAPDGPSSTVMAPAGTVRLDPVEAALGAERLDDVHQLDRGICAVGQRTSSQS